MKMNRNVISYFCILISLVLVVHCDEVEDKFDASQYGDFDPPTKEYATDPKILSRDVKCLVCQATLREMELEIKKVDPRKKVDVSGFRMDPSGNSVTKSVQYLKSEMYLTELMDTVCKKLEDYAKARFKDTRKLTVLKMMTEDGGMNPLMSAVDFVQDGDLNKSLEHFCLEVLEDHEEAILEQYMLEQTPKNVDHIICTKTAKYCNDDDSVPDSDDEDDNEYRDEL